MGQFETEARRGEPIKIFSHLKKNTHKILSHLKEKHTVEKSCTKSTPVGDRGFCTVFFGLAERRGAF